MGRPKVTKEDIAKRVQRIDVNELIEYHSQSTGAQDTRNHFQLTWSEYNFLKEKYNLKIDNALTVERRKQTKVKLYGDENYNNMFKNKATKLERYGNENYNNSVQQVATSKARWGDNYNNRHQMQKTFSSFSNEKKNIINNKKRNTKQERYGIPTYNNMRKHIETCKVCPSKPEEEMYLKLVNAFGKEDVIRQYMDSRYPFNCDFYIKSKDLFIEYQGTWTHGGHRFDSTNEEDLKKVALWESKNTAYYNNAIYTWTILDIKKYNIAKENNLNIRFIYPQNN